MFESQIHTCIYPPKKISCLKTQFIKKRHSPWQFTKGKGAFLYQYLIKCGVMHTGCSVQFSVNRSASRVLSFLLQIVHKGRRPSGLIRHTSSDALSFDVNYTRQERTPDGQNCPLRCIASEVQCVLKLRCYCYPTCAGTRDKTDGVSSHPIKNTRHSSRWRPKGGYCCFTLFFLKKASVHLKMYRFIFRAGCIL